MDDYDQDDDTFQSDNDDLLYEPDDENDIESAEESVTYSRNMEKKFDILNKKDICIKMEQDINNLSALLSISPGDASILLRHNGWNVSNVSDKWFSNERKLRKQVGLFEVPIALANNNDGTAKVDFCSICFESYPRDYFKSLSCGHCYCGECWLGYITTSINNDGIGSLRLRCPAAKCRASVTPEIIESLASDNDKKRYSDYLITSYVEQSRDTELKQCPAPNCEFILQYVGLGERENSDVTCACNYRFCFDCGQERHRPASCKSVVNWLLKNNSEAENTNYIINFTKPCPSCQRPIEKNKGCMHMTCRLCAYQFCWLCLGGWGRHNLNACNKYTTSNNEVSKQRNMAQNHLYRYVHHFERWATNKKSIENALQDLEHFKNTDCKILSEILRDHEFSHNYIIEAWEQIVECRQFLKWTYAYGYYSLDEDVTDVAKKNFFEYLQGEAEIALEKLHSCTENELRCFLDVNAPSKNYADYRTKVIDLTTVTKNYFKKLMKALENNLSDIETVIY